MAKKKNLAWLNCSELELKEKIVEWSKKIDLKNSILFLEGEMGAGKSTFVRTLLQILNPAIQTAGSPTFSIVNEYQATAGFQIYHIDLYRLKSEAELMDSGVESQIEGHDALVCIEWSSLFPDYFSYWLDPLKKKSKQIIQIQIDPTENPELRDFKIKLD